MGIFVPRCNGKFQHVTHLLTHLSILRKRLQNFLLACTRKIKSLHMFFMLFGGEVVTRRKQVQDIWSFSTYCPPHAQTCEIQGSSSVLLGIKYTRAPVIAELLASCCQEHWLWESGFDSTPAPSGRGAFCKRPRTVCPRAGWGRPALTLEGSVLERMKDDLVDSGIGHCGNTFVCLRPGEGGGNRGCDLGCRNLYFHASTFSLRIDIQISTLWEAATTGRKPKLHSSLCILIAMQPWKLKTDETLTKEWK